MNKTGLIYDPVYLDHDTGDDHPESPERLKAIHRELITSSDWNRLIRIGLPAQPRQGISNWIQLAHQPAHIKHIESSQPQTGHGYLDADTLVSSRSYPVSLLAVEGVLTAIDAVFNKTVANAFCAIRPPGHHAESNRAMGFCLFNNVAVGARYIQEHYKMDKVFIVDWDVHHGNGTQEIFYEDPTVFYFSVHQHPLYPGTGRQDEHGKGKGEDYTLNCPLPSGKGDDDYITIFEKCLRPAVEAFRPDFILISSGFDAHRDDPLAGMRVTEQGFSEMTRLVVDWAAQHCNGRVVSCLEGGYNLDALAKSVKIHIDFLMR